MLAAFVVVDAAVGAAAAARAPPPPPAPLRSPSLPHAPLVPLRVSPPPPAPFRAPPVPHAPLVTPRVSPPPSAPLCAPPVPYAPPVSYAAPVPHAPLVPQSLSSVPYTPLTPSPYVCQLLEFDGQYQRPLVPNYSVSARGGQPVVWRGSNLSSAVFSFPLLVPFLVRACSGRCMFPSWLAAPSKTPGIPCVRELCSNIAADKIVLEDGASSAIGVAALIRS